MVAGLADADPLGVNVNVSFDDVGGLDDRMLRELPWRPTHIVQMSRS